MANDMQIRSALRLKPFSHQPGSYAMLPRTTLCVQVFPTLIKITDLAENHPKEMATLKLSSGGIIENFTLQQDLERNCLKVWGNSPNGYFRFRLQASSENNFSFTWERKPENTEIQGTISSQATLFPQAEIPASLSFGVSKAQDWTLLERRLSLEELLPFWFRLGQVTPKTASTQNGNAALLKEAEDAITHREANKLATILKNLFRVGFEGILVPSLSDKRHLGLLIDYGKANEGSPLTLLTEGAKIIQRMLVDQSESEIKILQCRPPELHCGRLIGLTLPNGDSIDLEWSKKMIRRLAYTPLKDGIRNFVFPKDVSNFRFRHKLLFNGQIIQANAPLDLCAGERYSLDNFR
jgi:hypothetical protein